MRWFFKISLKITQLLYQNLKANLVYLLFLKRDELVLIIFSGTGLTKINSSLWQI